MVGRFRRWRQRGSSLPSLLAVLLFCAGCFEDDDGPLPVGQPCDAADPASLAANGELSFDPEQRPCVQLGLSKDDLLQLAQSSRFGAQDPFEGVVQHLTTDCVTPFPAGYPWFEAEVQSGGRKLTRVGLRKKGFLGSVTGHGMEKPSIKLRTDRHVAEQRFGTQKRLTLNNSAQDSSRVRSCLAYDVFDWAGYPAPRCNIASVMAAGQPMGAYAHLEPIKKPFLRRAFGADEGSLYEGTLSDLMEDFFPDTDEHLGRWQSKTGETDSEGAPLRRLQLALQAPDGELLSALEPVLNLDRFLTFWALELLVGHRDGYAGNRNNFYVYFHPLDGGRAHFIPWGADEVMGDEGERATVAEYVFAELPRRLSRLPEVAEAFRAEIERQLEATWNEDRIIERMELYASHVRRSETSPSYEDELSALRQWLLARPGQVRQELAGGVPRGAEQAASCFALGLADGLGAAQDIAGGVHVFTHAW